MPELPVAVLHEMLEEISNADCTARAIRHVQHTANLDIEVIGADGEVAGESDEPIDPNAQDTIVEEVEISPMQWIHAHGIGAWQATVNCQQSGLVSVEYTVLIEVHY